MDRDLLVELLEFDTEAGVLRWKRRDRRHFPSDWAWKVWNKRFPGTEAGSLSPQGYRFVSIEGKSRAVHRVIWLIVYGNLPEAIDHINGDRADNRLCNLRAASVAENNRNAKRRKDNRSGVTGVDWAKRDKKWRAQIAVDGRDISLGYYEDLSDAIAARKAAERQYGFHENHGRV